MPEVFVKKPDPEIKNEENDPVRTLLSWIAPARPYRKKDRSYYTTIAIIMMLFILIALLAQEILLIGVILSVVFVVYVLSFNPPQEIEYKISTQGVIIGDHFYFWDEMHSFWFSEKEGQTILNILTNLRFPGQLMLLIGSQDKEEVKKKVANYLPYHEIAPRSLLDKWAEGLQKHFPLENPHAREN